MVRGSGLCSSAAVQRARAKLHVRSETQAPRSENQAPLAVSMATHTMASA